jgi:hypothetical protein
MIRTRMLSALAAGVVAATTAAPALAGGERKNESPFVRPVGTQSLTGEAKNQPPFNGTVQVPPTIVVTSTHSGFSWLDAAIGAAAGVGATCATGALAALAWTSRRTAAAQ